MKNLSVLISTMFGVGCFPKIPGTAGSFFAALIYWLLPVSWFVDFPANLIFFTGIFILGLISVFFISKAEEELGHDNGKIVIDEFFGFMIAVAFLPKNFSVLLLGFIFFRVFDILKPEPINILQKLPKGWGVLADDLMAGVYANLTIRVFLYLIK